MIRCAKCAKRYTVAEFDELPNVGTMPDYQGGTLSLRNCSCHNTIARELDAEAPGPRAVDADVAEVP